MESKQELKKKPRNYVKYNGYKICKINRDLLQFSMLKKFKKIAEMGVMKI